MAARDHDAHRTDHAPPTWITQQSTRGLFTMGSPRSGTSALAWALAQHPLLATGPEADFPFFVARTGFLRDAFDASAGRADGWFAKNRVSRAEFMSAVGLGLDLLFRSRYGERRWIDSTPSSVLVCDDLAAMFPRASFVHMVRDGRAVVCSMMNSGFDQPFARDFRVACADWASLAMAGRAFAMRRPDVCVEVRQEELALDPAAVLRPVFALLGIEPHEECARFLKKGRINSSWAGHDAADPEKVTPAAAIPAEPWRSWSRSQKATFRSKCGAAMEALGYELVLAR